MQDFTQLKVWTGGINAWETTGDTPFKKHIVLLLICTKLVLNFHF